MLEIFGRKETEEFSITYENHRCRWLQELKKTLSKGRGHFKGHSEEGASKPAILVVYVLGGIFDPCLFAQLLGL
jgi:hypothetical protein